MTAADVHRIRRYQRLMIAWGILNDETNIELSQDERPPQAVIIAWRELQAWLLDEQEAINRLTEV